MWEDDRMSGGIARGLRPALAAAVAVGAVMVLAGCTPAAGGSSSQPPRAGDDGSSQEPVDPLAECLAGTWQLDTADFLAQSTAYLQGLGIPLDGLDVEGGQQITFAEDDYFTQSTDLTWTASLMGYTITVPSQSVGEAVWTVDDGGLSVSEWNWLVDPSEAPAPSGLPAGAEVPDLPSFSLEDLEGDDLTCGDTITLQGPDAPLSGVFVRID
jgi:hypothetical protein